MRLQYLSRLLLLVVLLSLCGSSYAQKKKKKTAKPQPTTLSVRNVAGNYNINVAFLSDTLNFAASLDSMDSDDNLMLATYCNEIGRRVHEMKNSLKNDYRMENNLIWIDDNTVINDYLFYEGMLDKLAAAASARSQYYLAREKRQQEERERLKQQEAEAEAARQLAKQTSTVFQLKQRIEQQHADITASCDIRTMKDKSRAREYKSLYYAYLAVYNHYNLTQDDISQSYQDYLNELATMQRHFLDSTLSDDNYTSRIERFPNQLRDSAGIDYTDIVRAYRKYFVHTAVSITFNNTEEYYRYAHELEEIHRVQCYYLDVVALRKTIDKLDRDIVHKQEKKYPNPVYAYRQLHDSYNFTPTFNNEANAIEFISMLNDFIAMQRIYLRSFERLEAMAQRADTIFNLSRGHLSDIRGAYKKLEKPELKVPAFHTSAEAKDYEDYLTNFEQVQQHYLTSIKLRNTIHDLDNRILDADNLEKVLKSYYKSVCKHTVFTPNFETDKGGADFVQTLNNHIEFQQTCLADIALLDTLMRTEVEINAYSKSHSNIYAVYKQVFKSYQMEQIASDEELDMYREKLESIRSLQEIIIEILRSKDATEINIRMKSLRDMGQMKQVLKLN